jgi:hypothetical protein
MGAHRKESMFGAPRGMDSSAWTAALGAADAILS